MIWTFKIRQIWLWLKQHWQIPFLLAWTVITVILTRRNSEALVDVLGAKQEAYQKEIALLRKNHLDEILARDKLITHYNESLAKIEEKFTEKERLLSEEETQKVKEIIVNSKGNPDFVKKKFEELFDIDYVN